MTAIARNPTPASSCPHGRRAALRAAHSARQDQQQGAPSMPKQVPNLPGLEPGPYPFSQVVEANGFVFLAGQVGDAPGSHGAVPGGIEAETRAMFDNVGRLLDAVGLSYADVVKCTVYLRDFGDFGAMNKVYREFFPQDAPTRATVGV